MVAQLQTRPGFWRRLFGWFGRHKVTAVFVVLMLAGGVYLGISDLMWQAQVRAERQQFRSAAMRMNEIATKLDGKLSSSVLRSDSCSYTSPTSIFTTGYLSCDVGIQTGYVDMTLVDAEDAAETMAKTLSLEFSDFRKSVSAYDAGDLAVYDFTLEGLNCFYSSVYYDSQTYDSSKNPWALSQDINNLITINCSQSAKEEYFPVVDN